ncbi:MAG: hypothetical protein H6Q72_4709 [Firmicutes bacterium]|nr:hypothetical protein [Bacillota bacterium]
MSEVTCEQCNLGCPVPKLMDGLQAEKARAKAAEARVAELVDVLEFYADRNTYFAARKALAKAEDGDSNA